MERETKWETDQSDLGKETQSKKVKTVDNKRLIKEREAEWDIEWSRNRETETEWDTEQWKETQSKKIKTIKNMIIDYRKKETYRMRY